MRRHIAIHNNEKVPVIAEVDLLVIGGSLSGLSLAVHSADKDQKIMIIDRRTFLGYEMTSANRPWVIWKSDFRKIISEWFEIHGQYEENSCIPLKMHQLKYLLETLFMQYSDSFNNKNRVMICLTDT